MPHFVPFDPFVSNSPRSYRSYISYPFPEGDEALHAGGIHRLSTPVALRPGRAFFRRCQCWPPSGTYHSNACIIAKFSRVGSWPSAAAACSFCWPTQSQYQGSFSLRSASINCFLNSFGCSLPGNVCRLPAVTRLKKAFRFSSRLRIYLDIIAGWLSMFPGARERRGIRAGPCISMVSECWILAQHVQESRPDSGPLGMEATS